MQLERGGDYYPMIHMHEEEEEEEKEKEKKKVQPRINTEIKFGNEHTFCISNTFII